MSRIRAVRTNLGLAIPFRIEFLLDRRELTDALAWSVRHDDPDDEPLPMLSRTAAFARVGETLREAGGQNFTDWEDYATGRQDAIRAWAEATVDREFGPIFEAAEKEDA